MEAKIQEVIPICEKKRAYHLECIHTCAGVYPCTLTVMKLGKDEDTGVLCISKDSGGKWVNFCLWRGKQDPLELVVRFSLPIISTNQLASVLLSKPITLKKS